MLLAWVESRDSAQRVARRFKPLPAVVLRMGSSCRRLCLWPLSEILPWAAVESANKRIAYSLHAPQKYATPDALRIPLPGTFLRIGRTRLSGRMCAGATGVGLTKRPARTSAHTQRNMETRSTNRLTTYCQKAGTCLPVNVSIGR